jgi:predicted DNA-binding protein
MKKTAPEKTVSAELKPDSAGRKDPPADMALTARTHLNPGTTSRESDKFILRLPDGMRERLAKVAESEGRSMTAVVVGSLARYLEGVETPQEVLLRSLSEEVKRLSHEVREVRMVVMRETSIALGRA